VGGFGGASNSVTDSSIFSPVWTTLMDRYKSPPPDQLIPLLNIMKDFLVYVGPVVTKSSVSMEMDTFYKTLEDGRDAAQARASEEPDQHALTSVLNVRQITSSYNGDKIDASSRISSTRGVGPRSKPPATARSSVCC
jgi:hypothetical protein